MKNSRTKTLFICLLIVVQHIQLIGQKNNKVWFDGFSRSYFARDAINDKVIPDTVSARNASDG